jgi:type I restriction enzyme S subunit
MEVIKKGYQQTEIGVIPKDWEISNIGDCSIRIGDGIHSTPKYDESGDYFFINGNNLVNGEILINENTKRVSEEESLIHKRNLGFSTILLSINGTIGNIAFYQNEKIILGKSAAYINLNNKVNSYFFYQMLQTNFLKEYFKNELTGSTIKNLGLNSIRNTPIPLPPLPEQKAIAEVLSDMDNLITALERQIEKKRLVKQGAMQRLLTAGEDWEVRTLGEVFNITAGGDLIKDAFSQTQTGEHLYPIYSNALTNKGLYGYSKVYRNDGNCITVTARGMVGSANERNHKFDAIGRVLILRPISKTNCFYSSEYINNKISFSVESTGVPQLTAPQMSKYEIQLPTYKEQTRIATILSDMDGAIAGLEKQLEKYRAVKVGLMQELLSGRKRLV